MLDEIAPPVDLATNYSLPMLAFSRVKLLKDRLVVLVKFIISKSLYHFLMQVEELCGAEALGLEQTKRV